MQSHAASGHQHRTRNVAGLPFHPLDITARGHNFPAQAFVALVALTVAVDCMPVHVAILMWQRSALAVLAPMLERQLPRDAHVRFLARKKFRDAVHLLAFPAEIAVEVKRGRLALQQLYEGLGWDRNRVLPYRLMRNDSIMRSHSCSSSSIV